MKGRGLVVFLALILATLATAGVFMYSSGVEEEAKSGGTMVQVVVSKVDLPARTDLDQLIKDDQFRIVQVPEERCRRRRRHLDRPAGGQEQQRGHPGRRADPRRSHLGERAGRSPGHPGGHGGDHRALETPRGVAGSINSGDHVTIYSTFKDAPTKTSGAAKETVTVVLVPTAELLGGVPSAHERRVRRRRGRDRRAASRHADRYRCSFARGRAALRLLDGGGAVWFGLLPPDANGQTMEPITYAQVVT